MHFFPDTGDVDAAAESFWAEDFKRVIRNDLRRQLRSALEGNLLRHAYRRYADMYPDAEQFTDRLAEMITIGAENGTDAAFDDIYNAFLTESPLPEPRLYARPLLPRAFPRRVRGVIGAAVKAEYCRERVFRHAYKVGYQGEFRNFNGFIGRVATLVLAGAMRGTDEMLARVFRSLLRGDPLPPARRNPKRLKSW